MCGRYVLFTDEEEDDISELVKEIQRKLAEEDADQLRANGEVFPTQFAPVVTKGGATAMRWGLPGYGKTNAAIINARSET
ncbi:MAG: SOS response-associated peptidase, partial [Defluviitaleaceae bacterium]|nr:SOS response-associated peptidase [Defluviitaleaceae bacterium]